MLLLLTLLLLFAQACRSGILGSKGMDLHVGLTSRARPAHQRGASPEILSLVLSPGSRFLLLQKETPQFWVSAFL